MEGSGAMGDIDKYPGRHGGRNVNFVEAWRDYSKDVHLRRLDKFLPNF